MTVAWTFWPRVKDAAGRRCTTSLGALARRFASPVLADDKMALPGWSPATFAGDRRRLDGFEQASGVGLDFDADADLDELHRAIEGLYAFLHTTWGHGLDGAKRARAVVWLAAPVTDARAFGAVLAHLTSRCLARGLVPDRACKDPSRLWFVPAAHPARVAAFRFVVAAGERLDPGTVPPLPDLAPAQGADDPGSYVPPAREAGARVSVEERAIRYLESCEPAVAGQGGHRQTFIVAQKVARGFAFAEERAFALLARYWNPRCSPPWSEHDLRRKVHEASVRGTYPVGQLREGAAGSR